MRSALPGGYQYRRSGQKTARHPDGQPRAANWLAEHFASVVQGARFTLYVANTAHRMLGTQLFAKSTAALTKVSQGKLPQWTPAMPQPVQRLQLPEPATQDDRPRVVYLAACVSRVMGPAAKDQEQQSLFDKTCGLLEKVGYQVIFPDNLNALCCGQPFVSKGYAEQAEHKRQEALDALLKASRGGLDPIYCDTSPCTLRLMQDLADDKAAVQICDEGISTSRTCEIGLSQHSGIDYHGLVYLVDRVSRRKPAFRPASSQAAAPMLEPVAEWP